MHEWVILLKPLRYFLMDFKSLEARIVIFASNIIDTRKRRWMGAQFQLCALGTPLPAIVGGGLRERMPLASPLPVRGHFPLLSFVPCPHAMHGAWPSAQPCLLYISVSILHQFSTWNLLVLCCRFCYICLQKQVLSSFSKEGLSFVFISKMWCLPYLVRSFLCPTRCELSEDRW